MSGSPTATSSPCLSTALAVVGLAMLVRPVASMPEGVLGTTSWPVALMSQGASLLITAVAGGRAGVLLSIAMVADGGEEVEETILCLLLLLVGD